MNFDAIIAVSEVIGVIAIIASLIYVATQIRQSATIARATIIHATNSDGMRLQDDGLEDVLDKLSVEFVPMFSTPEVRHWWRTTQSKTYFPGFVLRVNKLIDAAWQSQGTQKPG